MHPVIYSQSHSQLYALLVRFLCPDPTCQLQNSRTYCISRLVPILSSLVPAFPHSCDHRIYVHLSYILYYDHVFFRISSLFTFFSFSLNCHIVRDAGSTVQQHHLSFVFVQYPFSHHFRITVRKIHALDCSCLWPPVSHLLILPAPASSISVLYPSVPTRLITSPPQILLVHIRCSAFRHTSIRICTTFRTLSPVPFASIDILTFRISHTTDHIRASAIV